MMNVIQPIRISLFAIFWIVYLLVMSFLDLRNYSADSKYYRFHQKYGVKRTSILKLVFGLLTYPFEYLETNKPFFTDQTKKWRWPWGAVRLPAWWYFKNELLGAGCILRYINLLILCVLIISFFLLGGCDVSVTNNKKIEVVEFTPEEQSVALQVSKDFLHKLDRGDFEIWNDLSKTIHQTSTKTEWKILTKTMRKAPGKLIKRKSYGMVCTEALPGAPEGRYIIIDINSTFERAELIERVVVILEDGSWKIAGYHMTKKISFKQEKS